MSMFAEFKSPSIFILFRTPEDSILVFKFNSQWTGTPARASELLDALATWNLEPGKKKRRTLFLRKLNQCC